MGVHQPDYLTAQHLARAAGLPVAFLYAPGDEIAALLFRYSRASELQQTAVRKLLEDVPGPPTV